MRKALSLSPALQRIHRWAHRLWLGVLTVKVALLLALIGIVILDAAIQRANAAPPARQPTRTNGTASQTSGAAPTPTENKKNIYMFGIKCYVANGVSATDRRYNADRSRSAAFRAMAEKSYAIIWKMGPVIGKSNALINEDIESYQTMLRDAFLRDDPFFQRVRSECSRIGLM